MTVQNFYISDKKNLHLACFQIKYKKKTEKEVDFFLYYFWTDYFYYTIIVLQKQQQQQPCSETEHSSY